MTRKPEPSEAVAARNRKARAAKRDRGLVRIPGYVPEKMLPQVKAAIETLLEQSTETCNK